MARSEKSDVITFEELRDALERLGGGSDAGALRFPGYTPTGAAGAIIDTALNLRAEASRTRAEASRTPGEHITKDQLKDALKIAGFPSSVGYVIRPATRPFRLADMRADHAATAIWKVKDEPEYKSGDIVKDALGHLYKRHEGGWLGFGTGGEVDFVFPRRPLKKVKIGGGAR